MGKKKLSNRLPHIDIKATNAITTNFDWLLSENTVQIPSLKVKINIMKSLLREKYIDGNGNIIPSIMIELIARRAIESEDKLKNGIFIIELLCRPSDRKAIIGDLLEAYDDVLKVHGDRRANIWFRVQVFKFVLIRLRSLPGIAAIGLALNWIGHKISF